MEAGNHKVEPKAVAVPAKNVPQPCVIRLPKEDMLRRAINEDKVLEIVLNSHSRFVMHGGTAIWRCYNGNRFSSDIDFYTNLNTSESHMVQKQLCGLLIESGYHIEGESYSTMNRLLLDPRYTMSSNPGKNGLPNKTMTLHITFTKENSPGKLDVTFMTEKVKFEPAEYLRTDGSKRIVYTVVPEGLLKGKIDKYLYGYRNSKTHKIQDLYDIALLKQNLTSLSDAMQKTIVNFIAKIKRTPPSNELELQNSILNGKVLNFKELLEILEGG